MECLVYITFGEQDNPLLVNHKNIVHDVLKKQDLLKHGHKHEGAFSC